MDFSMNNIKKNLKWLVCAFLGLFHFVWLAIPYATAFVSYGKNSMSEGISGYDTMGVGFTQLDAGFLTALFQGLALVVAILMLAISAYILVKEFFGIDLPDKIAGPWDMKTLCSYALMAYAALNVLVLISLIIASLANTESRWGASTGIGLGFGIFLTLILSAGSFGAFFYMEKKNPELLASNSSKYVCSQCGAAAKEGNAFCASCGGAVVKVEPQPKAPKMEYVCQQCNEKYKKEVAFCSKCGGKVEAQAPAVWCCENCGELSKEGVAFCSKCGGKIVKK